MKHIGRPTNKEIQNRKRIKSLKVMLPVSFLIIILVVINEKTALLSLLGDSVDNCKYTCKEGYELDNDKCTLVIDKNYNQVDALLVGDANQDKIVNIKDYNIIKNAIKTKQELDNNQQVIFDLNDDGLIDENDLSIDYFSSIQGQSIFSLNYKCPVDKQVKSIDSNGNKIVKQISYELKDKSCSLTIKKSKVLNAQKICGDRKKSLLSLSSSK